MVATRSAGKLRELLPLFTAAGIEALVLVAAGIAESPDEDELEVFATFEENALAKARFFHALSGLPTVADDSGVSVNALDGRPGVHSKRWSGRPDLSGQQLDDENNRLLLLLLERLGAAADRRAHYVCAAAYVSDHEEVVRRGEVHGRILHEARGVNGFGYDPYFFADELAMTFGEASVADKERVSHRGRAFRALLSELDRGRGAR